MPEKVKVIGFVTVNGQKVLGTPEHWMMAIIATMTDAQRAQVLNRVREAAPLLNLNGVTPHVLFDPGGVVMKT